MKKILIALILTLTLTSVYCQESTIENKIRRMMDVLGTSHRFETVIDKMIELEKENFPSSVEDKYWNQFKEKVKNDGFNELIELLIPIYKKHLTESEIESIITFYESEAGQKMVNKFPSISQESMQVGAEWGKNLSSEIAKEIQESDELKFNTNLEDCGSFKKGSFIYLLPDGKSVKMERTEDLQIETVGNNEIRSRVEWISKCRYNVIELDENNIPVSKEPLEVNIYKVNNNSYKFISKMKGDNFYSEGEIEKVN